MNLFSMQFYLFILLLTTTGKLIITFLSFCINYVAITLINVLKFSYDPALVCESGIDLTLSSTNHIHTCLNETPVITCSGGIGEELEWNYNGNQFLFRNNSAELPDARLTTPVTVYVINRTKESNKTYRYISQLVIDMVMFDFVNITCTVKVDSVSTETDSLFVQTSGKQKKLLG